MLLALTFAALDARWALLLLLGLLGAAVAPLAVGWLALLPAEREPFRSPDDPRRDKPRDAFAIFLLVNTSISFFLRIPAFDATPVLTRWISRASPDYADHAVMVVMIWFGFIPGLAAAYAAVRANPLRWPLLAGGALTLVLWLAGPWLLAQISGAN